MKLLLLVLLAANNWLLMILKPEVGFSLPQVEFFGFLTVDLSGLPLSKIIMTTAFFNSVVVVIIAAIEIWRYFFKSDKKEEVKQPQEV